MDLQSPHGGETGSEVVQGRSDRWTGAGDYATARSAQPMIRRSLAALSRYRRGPKNDAIIPPTNWHRFAYPGFLKIRVLISIPITSGFSLRFKPPNFDIFLLRYCSLARKHRTINASDPAKYDGSRMARPDTKIDSPRMVCSALRD